PKNALRLPHLHTKLCEGERSPNPNSSSGPRGDKGTFLTSVNPNSFSLVGFDKVESKSLCNRLSALITQILEPFPSPWKCSEDTGTVTDGTPSVSPNERATSSIGAGTST